MNTYDIFDTIISRICYSGDELINIVHDFSGFNDFFKMRKQFEFETHDFNKTYE